MGPPPDSTPRWPVHYLALPGKTIDCRPIGRARLQVRQGVFLWLMLGALSSLSCGGGRIPDRNPESDPRIHDRFRAVSELSEDRAARPALVQELRSVTASLPSGRTRDYGLLLLSRLEFQEGRVEEAKRALSLVSPAPSGALSDEAALLKAALMTHEGQPDKAFRLLDPLSGKLFGEPVRLFHAREKARAATLTRRWRVAMFTIDEWIRSGKAGSVQALEFVRKELPRFPESFLVRLLQESNQGAPSQRLSAALEKEVLLSLTRRALASNDAMLAGRIVQLAPAWLLGSEQGDSLKILASLAKESARVLGRKVGLVVGGNDLSARTHGIQAASGIHWALEEGQGKTTELLIEEHRGSMAQALAVLTGRGASLLVAVGAADDAREALSFGRERGVPILLLSDPAADIAPDDFGFFVGESEKRQKELLLSGLNERGVSQVVLVGTRESGSLSCQRSLGRPSEPRFPIGEWRHRTGLGFLLGGGAECAEMLLLDLSLLTDSYWVALLLEARGVSQTSRQKVLSLKPTALREDLSSLDWYELLGRDAGRLSSTALRQVAEANLDDATAVRRHHAALRDALAGARTDLLSTSEKGFDSQHRIQRELTLASSEPGPR